jgi:Flp pilus assembly protein TadG
MISVRSVTRTGWTRVGCGIRRLSARKRERGAYLVIFAIMLPVFIGFTGLGVDMSHYWWVRSQLQTAADAGAFAGSQSLNSTSAGRTNAVTIASTYATQNKADGKAVTAAEVTEKITGKWDFATNTFSSTNISDVDANAIKVTVQRQNVRSFFAPIVGAHGSQTLLASSIGVAGGARQVACAAPVAVATCTLTYDSSGKLNCPTNLSFQNAAQSVGLTHPDGSSPVNGNNSVPYFADAVQQPLTCSRPAVVGTSIPLQNGNDLRKTSVDDINAATTNGISPVQIVAPVVDLACGSGGPTYNQSAKIVGFIKMKVVGARWTSAAPANVAAACPTLGKKNLCVSGDCSMINGAPGGGTIQVSASKVYLVN